ncbi:MAG: M56 family metallopeptidase [Sphingopyxis sp.]|uniref:M56 family metallopeptidase n=1 Tax=Sphingopyxis sp. TaxID=1908224 RepID=UPI003D80D650
MTATAMLLGLAWKSAAIAALTLALLRVFRARSAGERSLIAHVGLAALLALPAAMLLLPQWAPLPADMFAAAVPAASSAPDAADPTMAGGLGGSTAMAVADASGGSSPPMLSSLADALPFVYALPLALLFAAMAVAVVRLFAMRRRADVLTQGSWLSALAEAQRRMGFKHGTALLVSDELRSPISWGVLRPTIVLSPKAVLAVGEAEAIIAHELAHVARLDWAKLLAARLACALFWFNPLVWMLARESHQLREEAADDAVLMADIDGPDYATLLVGAARHDNQGTLLAAHGVAPGRNSLKRRITRVLDGSLKRGPASASWALMSLVLLAGITAPLAAFSATADEKAATDVPAVAAAIAPTAGAPLAAAAAASPAAAAAEPVTVDQLIGMRAVGATPEDVRSARDRDGRVDIDDVIAAKATGVDAGYIAAMRGVFPDADVGDLIGARSVGVDPAYAREMKSLFRTVDLDELTGMRALGIDAAFVREMRRAGQAIETTDDAVEARAIGMAPRRGRPPAYRVEKPGGASVRVDADGSLEARSADGRVARIEMAEPPAPPAPPAD